MPNAASQRIVPAFIIADTNRLVHAGAEDLAVANLASLGSRDDRALDLVHRIVGDHHFNLDLRDEVHRILASAINLGVALLAPMAANLNHGHALDTNVVQRILHWFQLRRLDNGFNLCHAIPIPSARGDRDPRLYLLRAFRGENLTTWKLPNNTLLLRVARDQGPESHVRL